MNHYQICKALTALCPNSGWGFSGDVFPDGILFWEGPDPFPTLAAVQAQVGVAV